MTLWFYVPGKQRENILMISLMDDINNIIEDLYGYLIRQVCKRKISLAMKIV